MSNTLPKNPTRADWAKFAPKGGAFDLPMDVRAARAFHRYKRMTTEKYAGICAKYGLTVDSVEAIVSGKEASA